MRGAQLVARGGTQIDIGGGQMRQISWQEANGASRSGVFVVSEVRVLGGQKAGDDIQVAFATALGRKYRVEFRDTVEDRPLIR